MPYLFGRCIFETGCPRNSLCAWIIAFWMCLLGFIADAFWLPVAVILSLIWLCLMVSVAFKWCCDSCDKKPKVVNPVPNAGLPDSRPVDLENGGTLPGQPTTNYGMANQTKMPM